MIFIPLSTSSNLKASGHSNTSTSILGIFRGARSFPFLSCFLSNFIIFSLSFISSDGFNREGGCGLEVYGEES